MAIHASFSPATGTLTETGDSNGNTITTSLDAAGQISVNDGAVPIDGGQATVANTTLIQVFGQGGDDTITLDETNGALPAAQLFGGAGNDVLTGGSGADQLFAGAGNDTITGGDGNDMLLGRAGNDTVIGGRGADTAFLGNGNDTFVWNPGDGSDVVEGQAGFDTLQFNGANVNENIDISANGGRVAFTRDVAGITMDLNGIERINFVALGGADTITVDDLTGTGVKQVNIDLSGTVGSGQGDGAADTVIVNGTAGDDTVTVASSGSSVVVNGLSEQVTINGAEAANDSLVINARGGADNIVVGDLTGTGVKQVNIDLAGTPGSGVGDGQPDTVTVNGTAGDDTVQVTGSGGSVSVAGLPALVTISGSEAGSDQLVINTLGGDDVITAAGLPAATVQLTIDAGAGNDTITGGDGNDTLIGGEGDDFINGGKGNDTAQLGAGNDTFVWNPGDGSDVVDGQDGVDTLQFNGANVNENIDISANGGRVAFTRDVAGITMDLNGIERINFVALGGADNIVVGDLTGTGVKQVNIDLAGTPGSGVGDGQPDTVTVNGTAGDDTVQVTGSGGSVSVAGLPALVTISGSEAGSDQLVINTLGGDDVITAAGLPAATVQLTIDAGAGNDTITGGDGNDMLLGRAGNDTVIGGRGADTAFLGNGNDTFVWNPGDGSDVVEGQAGFDTLQFNGANVNENIDISANGGRVAFTRDVAGITMDLNGIERINFVALGGADTITVDDLTGTGVKQVNIDLSGTVGSGQGDGAADTVIVNGTAGDDTVTVASSGSSVVVNGLSEQVTINGAEAANDSLVINARGGADNIVVGDLTGTGVKQVNIDLAGTPGSGVGDGQPDTVTVNGTAGDDTVQVTGSGGSVSVAGLPALVTISGSEAGSDQLVINTLGGDDVITAAGLPAATVQLTIDAGAGNDTITGGDGNDMLLGRAGNDTVIGGRGADTAFLGNGNDTFVWNPGDGSDVVEGQAGFDTLQFNGANVNENIDISANGGRVAFTRDVAGITMDLNGIERINFVALGGADTITVDDLTGTGVKQVNIDLSGTVGSGQGDGAADTVSINATNGQTMTVADNNGVVTVSGLASTVTISSFEADLDHLVINDQSVTVADGQSVTVASANGNNTGGTSTASDASHAAGLALLGQFMASSFVTAGDGHAGTPIADPPSSQPPLLAQPHA